MDHTEQFFKMERLEQTLKKKKKNQYLKQYEFESSNIKIDIDMLEFRNQNGFQNYHTTHLLGSHSKHNLNQ